MEAFSLPSSLSSILLGFIFYYPLFMAYLWMIGAIYYYYHWETSDGETDPWTPPVLPEYPGVSIILPCHNEGENVLESAKYLLDMEYPEYEIIFVNDASSDNTGELIDKLAEQHDKIRALHLKQNQGKAIGLTTGALASRYEYLICLDGDAVLERTAIPWMMRHFLTGPRVGAVTGNPRIRTRSTLLGKIQVGEFSSIIGIIKRAQRIYGRIFTVSGVVAAFRKTALHRIGYWDMDMITEDVDVSWKLQLNFWDVRFEPNALCWILMPETLEGLWRQRSRWAQGGAEVFLKNVRHAFTSVKFRRMWPVIFEYIISVLWAYAMALALFLWALGKVATLPEYLQINSILPGWNGVLLGATCLLQFAVGLVIDGKFERKGSGRYYYWVIWYPMVYWVINVFTVVYGFPKAIFRKKGHKALWRSPDRGVRDV